MKRRTRLLRRGHVSLYAPPRPEPEPIGSSEWQQAILKAGEAFRTELLAWADRFFAAVAKMMRSPEWRYVQAMMDAYRERGKP